jgi:hypothetical protein
LFSFNVQFILFFFFIIPSFQFYGNHVLNIKILVCTLSLILLSFYEFLYKHKSFSYSSLLYVISIFGFLVVHAVFGFFSGNFTGNLYFYMKLVSGILIFLLLLFSDEVHNSRLWVFLLFATISIAVLQQTPYIRDYIIHFYGSIQGYISQFPYSRASGVSIGFYVYTQATILMFLIYKLHPVSTFNKKFSIFILLGSLLANTRSSFILPFYYLLFEFKPISRVIAMFFGVLFIFYMSENFAPIRTIYHHFILIYESGDLSPILNTQNISFTNRILDMYDFFNLFDDHFQEIFFFGLGSDEAFGQEIGYFYLITKVGLIPAIIYYMSPIIFTLSFTSARIFIRYLLLVIPIYFVDFLVVGFAKYDLYILLWVFTSFYIKKYKGVSNEVNLRSARYS